MLHSFFLLHLENYPTSDSILAFVLVVMRNKRSWFSAFNKFRKQQLGLSEYCVVILYTKIINIW